MQYARFIGTISPCVASTLGRCVDSGSPSPSLRRCQLLDIDTLRAPEEALENFAGQFPGLREGQDAKAGAGQHHSAPREVQEADKVKRRPSRKMANLDT
jgi:hypothetical protein